MGVKLIIFLGLVVAALYCIHLLVKDYQALTASKLLRVFMKRDVNSIVHTKASVRWRRILEFDKVQCARYVYCDIGARVADNAERRGFAYMLTLEPKEEDRAAWEVFKQAYRFGKSLKFNEVENCRKEFASCPFHASLLFQIIHYMLRNHNYN